MQIFPRLPRSPRLSPKIAGINDFAGREWVIACWDRKKWRGCQTGLTWSQSLPPKIAEIATENVGRHCGDCRGCWDSLDCRFWHDCRDHRECRRRLQGFPILPAENGWLPAETKKIDEFAGRECRDCRPKMPRVAGLLRVPNFQSEIAKSPEQDCWDCNGDYRPTLQRLQKLLGVPRLQINPRFSRLPRLSPKIAGITDFAGREWVIACWDRRKWRGCQTGLRWSQSLPPKIAEIAEVAGSEESAEFAVRNCQDCDGECRPTLRRLQRLLRLPRMQILARLPRSPRFSPEIAGSADIAGQEWMIACWDWKNRRGCRTGLPGLQTAAQKCRDCRGCWECRIFSLRVPEVLAKIVEIATEVAGRHCRDCRDCRSAEIADISNPVRSPRLPPKLAGIANIAGRECVIACWDRKKWRGCQTGITLLQRMPPKNAEIAEVAGSEENAEFGDRECQDCDGGCRPTLRRLQRLLRLPRMQILARLPRSPRLLPETAGIPDLAGREWVIARWDEKNEVLAGRDCRDCRPKMPRVAGLPGVKRMRNLETETAKIATEDVGRHCGDYRDCKDCRECRYLQDCRNRWDCRPRLPGLPTLPAENGWLHAETEKIDEVARRD